MPAAPSKRELPHSGSADDGAANARTRARTDADARNGRTMLSLAVPQGVVGAGGGHTRPGGVLQASLVVAHERQSIGSSWPGRHPPTGRSLAPPTHVQVVGLIAASGKSMRQPLQIVIGKLSSLEVSS